MSNKEIHKLLNDKFPSKEKYSAKEFAKKMKQASKSKLIKFEEIRHK